MEKKNISLEIRNAYKQISGLKSVTKDTIIEFGKLREFIVRLFALFPEYRIDARKINKDEHKIGDYVGLVLSQEQRKKDMMKKISAMLLTIAEESRITCVTECPDSEVIFYQYRDFLQKELEEGRVSEFNQKLAYERLCYKLYNKLCKNYNYYPGYVALLHTTTVPDLMELFYRKNRF